MIIKFKIFFLTFNLLSLYYFNPINKIFLNFLLIYLIFYLINKKANFIQKIISMSSKYKKNNFLNKKRSTKAEEESENSNEDINANEEADNNSDSSDKKTSNKIPSSNKDKKKSESENVIVGKDEITFIVNKIK